jgi:hypothetical protein
VSRNGNGHLRPSDAQLNAEALARRDVPNRYAYERSLAAKERRALERPRTFGALRQWFKREWDAEFPQRIHERGVEPDSQLGAPRLAGAMRARILAVGADPNCGCEDCRKALGKATATDYDRAHDIWSTGAAPRYPVLAALVRLHERCPLVARSLTALAYGGFDVYHHGSKRGWTTYQTDLYLAAELAALWTVWSALVRDAGRDAA